jgi:aldehyde dehydrogenase (NAD+)
VVNIVTGDPAELGKTLAGHMDVDAVWGFAPGLDTMIERESTSNLKRTWVNNGQARDWFGATGDGRDFLRRATEVKTVWVPYGE